MGDDPNQRGLSRKHILHAIDGSLRRLGTDYVDLYQIHRFDYSTPVEETLEALDDVVRMGKALYLGAWQSRFQQEKPVEWFVPVRDLVQSVKHSKLTEAGADKRHDRDVDWVLGELERAGPPILTLYAELERRNALSAVHPR